MKQRPYCVVLAGLIWLDVIAFDNPGRRLFELRTETGMPHLEENLRDAVRHEQRCLDPNDLSDAFWMLSDVSLQDCQLVKAGEMPNAASYRLVCRGGHGTSGDAQWRFDGDRISGTLNVKLGGKNMTFYQRVAGVALGSCGG